MLTPMERIKMIGTALEGLKTGDWELIKEVVEKELERERGEVRISEASKLTELIRKSYEKEHRKRENIKKFFEAGPVDIKKLRQSEENEPTTPSEEIE